MFCPSCPDKEESYILYNSNHKKDEMHIKDVKCMSEIHFKPTLYKCKKCDLIFSEYINVKTEESYTNVEDDRYVQQIPYKKKNFELLFTKISPYLNNEQEVLEIGSYYGILGSIIKPHVKKYTGLELSKHAAEYSQNNFNLNIANEHLDEFLNKKNLFDVIIMCDVIEHLDNPFEIIKKIEQNLKPNGIFIFSTMNMDSFLPKIMRGKYFWIMPQHKFYFTNSTLRYFLKKNNMNIFKIKNDARLVSVEYLLFKLCVFLPKINFIFKFLLKFNFLKKITIKINLFDLNIYFSKKLEKL
jgi:2-polyprenyl-3-methyl-5-hydroxy-6-metoxy-1,4-benzoquinol methylase